MEKIQKTKYILGMDKDKEFIKLRDKFIYLKKLKKARTAQKKPKSEKSIEIEESEAQPKANAPNLSDSQIIDKINDKEWVIITDRKTGSIEYGPRPKKRTDTQEVLDIEELEEFEPEIVDTDLVSHEYDLEFLEHENQTVKYELVKLQQSFQRRYWRMVQLSLKIKRLKALHMLMDEPFYRSKP